MTLLDRLIGGARSIALIDDKVDRLEKAVEKVTVKVEGHEQRLVRVETIIEIARGGASPRQPKLPRR
jgi:hypothetical protein